MLRHKKLIAIILVLALILPFYPARAAGLNFGGRIISSRFRPCSIGFFSYSIPFPVYEIKVRLTSGRHITLVYAVLTALLQIFGVYSTVYSWYQIYRAGPNVLGQYVPIPYVPWGTNGEVCTDLVPVNFITKIGTSLY